MELGMIGLGRMGANMSERLIKGGHDVVGFDLAEAARRSLETKGGRSSATLADLIGALEKPRVVWMMVPAGEAVDKTIDSLIPNLEVGDTLIDGGNSYFQDTIRRSRTVEEKGFHYVDVGTSGGIWGLKEGYSLMIGGEQSVVKKLEPIFVTLAPAADRGWGHVGPPGAGHFVKMVHNGIEYGMMQSFAEGMALLKKKDFDLDLHQIAEIWRSGSVVRSWLLDLIARALAENPDLEGVIPHVADSGEGRWTVFEAINQDVAAPAITLALLQRIRSRDDDSFGDKMLAVMREQFGGHAVERKESK